MMLIQALKKMKALKQEVEDLKLQIAAHCADYENESPVYGSPEAQAAQIQSWLQSIHDKLLLVQQLSLQVKHTNLATQVPIELPDGKTITLPLEGWIVMRREIAPMMLGVYASITDRGLKDRDMRTSTGAVETVKVRRHYDPKHRDIQLAKYRAMSSLIDGTLEVVNATTPLVTSV